MGGDKYTLNYLKIRGENRRNDAGYLENSFIYVIERNLESAKYLSITLLTVNSIENIVIK